MARRFAYRKGVTCYVRDVFGGGPSRLVVRTLRGDRLYLVPCTRLIRLSLSCRKVTR